MEQSAPDFASIKQINPYGVEYWSTRDLMPLLGYNKWERFEGTIKRAMTACEQTGNRIEDHFPASGKMIKTEKGAERETTEILDHMKNWQQTIFVSHQRRVN